MDPVLQLGACWPGWPGCRSSARRWLAARGASTPVRSGGAAYQVAGADEAIELANSGVFGLGGAIFSSDEKLAVEVADRLDVGMVIATEPDVHPKRGDA
jgi:hypothetical protein